MRFVIIALAIVLVVGLFPSWPYSMSWGYYPSGAALLLAVLAILFLVSNTKRGDIV